MRRGWSLLSAIVGLSSTVQTHGFTVEYGRW
jgi:hypothetical protein